MLVEIYYGIEIPFDEELPPPVSHYQTLAIILIARQHVFKAF